MMKAALLAFSAVLLFFIPSGIPYPEEALSTHGANCALFGRVREQLDGIVPSMSAFHVHVFKDVEKAGIEHYYPAKDPSV